MEITMAPNLRPCIVSGNGPDKKALFHTFIYQDGSAVIEFEDGKCTTTAPWSIKFVDNIISEYAFPDN